MTDDFLARILRTIANALVNGDITGQDIQTFLTRFISTE